MLAEPEPVRAGAGVAAEAAVRAWEVEPDVAPLERLRELVLPPTLPTLYIGYLRKKSVKNYLSVFQL